MLIIKFKFNLLYTKKFIETTANEQTPFINIKNFPLYVTSIIHIISIFFAEYPLATLRKVYFFYIFVNIYTHIFYVAVCFV